VPCAHNRRHPAISGQSWHGQVLSVHFGKLCRHCGKETRCCCDECFEQLRNYSVPVFDLIHYASCHVLFYFDFFQVTQMLIGDNQPKHDRKRLFRDCFILVLTVRKCYRNLSSICAAFVTCSLIAKTSRNFWCTIFVSLSKNAVVERVSIKSVNYLLKRW